MSATPWRLGNEMNDAERAGSGRDTCTLTELVDHAALEFGWSRGEVWRRLKQVAETRGLQEVIFSVQRPSASLMLHTQTTHSIADADRRLFVRSVTLRLLGHEFPRAIRSKRGPKPRFDWQAAYARLKAHWAETNGPSETQADDERFVQEFFSSTPRGEEPSERMTREMVKRWRVEETATRGHQFN